MQETTQRTGREDRNNLAHYNRDRKQRTAPPDFRLGIQVQDRRKIPAAQRSILAPTAEKECKGTSCDSELTGLGHNSSCVTNGQGILSMELTVFIDIYMRAFLSMELVSLKCKYMYAFSMEICHKVAKSLRFLIHFS